MNLFLESAIEHSLSESDVIEVQSETFFCFQKFTLKKQDIFNLIEKFCHFYLIRHIFLEIVFLQVGNLENF